MSPLPLYNYLVVGAILFAVVMTASGLLFVVAPMVGWWLPEAASTHAWSVDLLFYIILAITGFFFILTEAILCVFMYKYCSSEKGKPVSSSAPNFVTKMLAPATLTSEVLRCR